MGENMIRGRAAARLGLLTLATVLAVAGCGSTAAGKSAAADQITLTVSGTTSKASNITYTDGSVQTSQENDVAVPWTKTIEAKGDALTYQVLAQNGSDGDITCEIKDSEGKVLATNTSSGQFAVVTCNS